MLEMFLDFYLVAVIPADNLGKLSASITENPVLTFVPLAVFTVLSIPSGCTSSSISGSSFLLKSGIFTI